MSKEKSGSGLAIWLIVIGLSILLYNMNILKISMFWGIVKLWPFLFIVMGLSILFKSVRYLDVVLWLGFIGVVIAYSYFYMDDMSWEFGEEIPSVHYEMEEVGIEFGELEIDIPIGSIKVDSHDGPLEYDIPEDMTPIEVASDPFRFELKDDVDRDAFGDLTTKTYNVTLPEMGEWTLRLDTGIASAKVDLSEIAITDGYIDFGIGDIELILNEASSGKLLIDFGIGDATVIIPKSDDLGIKVITKGGLSTYDLPSDYKKEDNVYYSKNYDDSKHQLEITVDLGIGKFEIK